MKKIESTQTRINDEKEIIEFIKKIIVSYYPIVDDRLDILTNYPTPTLDICFNFF